jgi:hypothetical protein
MLLLESPQVMDRTGKTPPSQLVTVLKNLPAKKLLNRQPSG